MITARKEAKKIIPLSIKREQSAEIEMQTKEFLASGGKINSLDIVAKTKHESVGKSYFMMPSDAARVVDLDLMSNNQASHYLRINRQSVVASQSCGTLLAVAAPKCVNKNPKARINYTKKDLDAWVKAATEAGVYSR